MGFYVTESASAAAASRRAARPTPLKNRAGNFFGRSGARAWRSPSQPIESHQEKQPTATNIVLGMRFYGYRYYSPEVGRWLSRDPIGERGHFGMISKHGLRTAGKRKHGMNSDLLFVFAQNAPIDFFDPLGLDPRGQGGIHPAQVNPQFHLDKIAENLVKIEDHLSRQEPGFGCAYRLARDAFNHAVMYEEHTGDNGPRQDWQQQIDFIRDWENSYWSSRRTERFCERLRLVSGAVLTVCLPECLPLIRGTQIFRLCPVAP